MALNFVRFREKWRLWNLSGTIFHRSGISSRPLWQPLCSYPWQSFLQVLYKTHILITSAFFTPLAREAFLYSGSHFSSKFNTPQLRYTHNWYQPSHGCPVVPTNYDLRQRKVIEFTSYFPTPQQSAPPPTPPEKEIEQPSVLGTWRSIYDE